MKLAKHIARSVGILMMLSVTIWPESINAQAQFSPDSLQGELNALVLDVARATQVAGARQARIDSMSSLILAEKKRRPRTPLADRRLENLLEQAAKLQTQQELAQSALTAAEQTLRGRTEAVREDVQRWLAQIAQESLDDDPAGLQRVQAARRLLDFCLAMLQPKTAALRLTPVLPNAQDTPDITVQKTALLQDQADRLRRAQSRLAERAQQVRNEQRMRVRLQDFVDDLSLLESRGEQASGEPQAPASADFTATIPGQESNVRADAATSGPPSLVLPGLEPQLPLASLSSMSEDALDGLLQQLEKRQKELNAQADSLDRVAKSFQSLQQKGERKP